MSSTNAISRQQAIELLAKARYEGEYRYALRAVKNKANEMIKYAVERGHLKPISTEAGEAFRDSEFLPWLRSKAPESALTKSLPHIVRPGSGKLDLTTMPTKPLELSSDPAKLQDQLRQCMRALEECKKENERLQQEIEEQRRRKSTKDSKNEVRPKRPW